MLSGEAQLLGAVDPAAPIQIALNLRTTHDAELATFVDGLMNPRSPLFRQFLTFEELKSRYMPSDGTVATVQAWAATAGFRESYRSNTNQLVVFRSTVGEVNKAFDITVQQYRSDGRRFFANDRPPTLPIPVRDLVNHVSGLSSYAKAPAFHGVALVDEPRPREPVEPFIGAATSTPASSITPDVGQGSPGGPANGVLEPADLAGPGGYNYQGLAPLSRCCQTNGGPAGAPRETSIAILVGYSPQPSDYNTFFKQYAISANVVLIPIGGGKTCCDNEATLDIEWSAAMSGILGSTGTNIYEYSFDNGPFSIGQGGQVTGDGVDAYMQAFDIALGDNKARTQHGSRRRRHRYPAILSVGSRHSRDDCDWLGDRRRLGGQRSLF